MRKLSLIAICILTACSGKPEAVHTRDVEFLRAIMAPACERDDGKYVVLSSRPAAIDRWGIPAAWTESDRIRAELKRRAEAQIEWPSMDLCAGVKLAQGAAVDAAFGDSHRSEVQWLNFFAHFRGSRGLVKISLPAFTSTGDRAVVLIENSCGPMCAEGLYIEFRKEQGSWKAARVEQAWIA